MGRNSGPFWNLPQGKPKFPSRSCNKLTFYQIQVVLGCTYGAALSCAKISICCFYLRLSPDRIFRTLVFVVIAFVVAYSISGIFSVIFSCNPIAASWDLALAALPTTKCINRPALYLAQAGSSIFTDLLIFILPMRTIWGLQLPRKQKISVSAIFAVGLL